VWNANHADDVTAQTEAEIDAALAAMDKHLGQYSWRDPHRLPCARRISRPAHVRRAGRLVRALSLIGLANVAHASARLIRRL
jgi:hypothetical protein